MEDATAHNRQKTCENSIIARPNHLQPSDFMAGYECVWIQCTGIITFDLKMEILIRTTAYNSFELDFIDNIIIKRTSSRSPCLTEWIEEIHFNKSLSVARTNLAASKGNGFYCSNQCNIEELKKRYFATHIKQKIIRKFVEKIPFYVMDNEKVTQCNWMWLQFIATPPKSSAPRRSIQSMGDDAFRFLSNIRY